MSFTSNDLFDYAFIGLGCGNALMLLQLEERGLIQGKRILVIEPDDKRKNDRTFCFWMEPSRVEGGFLQDLVQNTWNSVFVGGTVQSLDPVKYYRVPGVTLNAQVRKTLERASALHLPVHYQGSAKVFEGKALLLIDGKTYTANYVFDNRPPSYEAPNISEARLLQSFSGWEIQTEEAVFDPECFTMMDFNVDQEGATQFMYVLPFDEHRALVEITRFGEQIITLEQAEGALKRYLESRSIRYLIQEKEQGAIPMFIGSRVVSNLHEKWINTGERAGMLKPSTGYSFERSLTYAHLVVQSIVDQKPLLPYRTSRFHYYDRLLLQLLRDQPNHGKRIFEQLFQRNPVDKVLRFLDERTRIKEDIALLSSLPISLFLTAVFKDIAWRAPSQLLKIPLILLAGIVVYLLCFFQQIATVYGLLGLGMLLVGIPHGALDHLYVLNKPTGFNLLKYVLAYLAMGAFVFALFWVYPFLGLLFFLIFSAWHFGNTDFLAWGNKNVIHGFLWGGYYLGGILISHERECARILSEMNIPTWELGVIPDYIWGIWIAMGGFFLLVSRTKWAMLWSILALSLFSFLPLIAAFGVFFVFQHSLYGWSQLKRKVQKTSAQLWIRALPFSLGSIILLLLVLTLVPVSWGQGFIFLAAVSFPHVVYTALKNSTT